MKKVFLIGDSIRMGAGGNPETGYAVYVRDALAGKAEVFAPSENARFAPYTLRCLHEWARDLNIGADVDVVHWNNGLWDALCIDEEGPLVPLEQYCVYLLRVLKRIRTLFPNARVVFALTTPCMEEAGEESTRSNADIAAYNKAAAEMLEPLGVMINDLNTPAKEIQKSYALDAVHYQPEGAKLLSAYVVSAIEKALAE